MTPKIKICGLKDPDNASTVLELRPDYIGFIFHPTSKRFVGNLDTAWISQLNGPKKTGVFVNADSQYVRTMVSQHRFQAVQLHGNESPDYCAELKNEGVEIIKAFGIGSNFDWTQLTVYEDMADYYLFDTQSPLHGGTGKTFDWSLLSGYASDKPYFLSGGISPHNIHDALRLRDDRLYALDLNSKFESEPGIKNTELLKETFQTIER